MAIGLQVWSGTPNSNATADTNVNWAEGMAPSAVNDSARSLMASAAKWRDDNNGSLITSGTSVAYTLVTNQVEGSLVNGYTVAMQFHATNDSSCTLAVDGLAATPLQVFPGLNAKGGEWTAGSWGKFYYSSTGTGQWVCASPPGFPTLTGALAVTLTLSTAYQTGPSVSNSTQPGLWFATGSVNLRRSGGTDQFIYAKLWDGTTVSAASVIDITGTAGDALQVTLSGLVRNPAGNINIAARKDSGVTATMAATSDDNSVSYITAIRIA